MESGRPTPHPGSVGTLALGEGALQIWTKNVTGQAGHHVVKGLRRKRLLQGLGCTERASRLLSCGKGRFIELEQNTGQKFLPQRSRIFCGSWLSLAGELCKVGAKRRQKNPNYRGAIGFWG